jgi:hypothetical protein
MEFAQRRQVETRLDSATPTRDRQLSLQSAQLIRASRHAGIFEAVHRLDAGLDEATREQLAKWIRDEYESQFGDVPLGFFARCHLGPPYVDHRLDLWQNIVEHYSAGDTVPEPYARARMLARTGSYDFIEVYASGELRPILEDGSVVA